MAYPEWMGPNVEARHVEMMGWGTEPAPALGPAPQVVEPPPGRANGYGQRFRYVGKVGDRECAVYAETTRDAAVRLGAVVVVRGDGWLDGSRCTLVVNNEPKRKTVKNPNGY